jgi:hypothetical protein
MTAEWKSSVKLTPIRLPGPNARKARAFEADIVQLRAQGYTFEAIREALAAAGILVSNSTVQREVARATRRAVHATPPTASGLNKGGSESPSMASAAPATAAVALLDPAVPREWRSGQDVAEAYTRSVITNPLIRAKENG